MPTSVTADYPPLEEKLLAVNGLNVIFQVTDRCVLSCQYCFAKGSHKGCGQREFMEAGLIDSAIKQSFNTRHDVVTFEWTGGEALLAGVDFYRRVTQSQQKHANKNYTNTVQTSGYLLDKELIDYFVENDYRISLTIDGPEEVHDLNRPASKGAPSLRQILKTRDYIVEKQGSCGAIVTVTKRSLGKEGEIMDFYRSLGVNYFHSNPYVYFEGHRVREENIGLTNEDFATYYINQFNARLERGIMKPTPVIIDYIFKCLAAGTRLQNALCGYGGRCLTNFVAIAPNGDTYLCPKFIGMKNMVLGNIAEKQLNCILSDNSPPMERLISERKSATDKCRKADCRYLPICNSGCPYYSYIASGGKDISHKDWLCEGKTMVYEYLESVFASLKNQPISTETSSS